MDRKISYINNSRINPTSNEIEYEVYLLQADNRDNDMNQSYWYTASYIQQHMTVYDYQLLMIYDYYNYKYHREPYNIELIKQNPYYTKQIYKDNHTNNKSTNRNLTIKTSKNNDTDLLISDVSLDSAVSMQSLEGITSRTSTSSLDTSTHSNIISDNDASTDSITTIASSSSSYSSSLTDPENPTSLLFEFGFFIVDHADDKDKQTVWRCAKRCSPEYVLL